ncbi:LuxR C-terminal-related transcriptional regulator [Pseudomonas sp. FME51]|uniref:LuxR C-terminal-related transcriptional regulator n=1 Tax=Pseudomonas sp. FME51 TaxID=2742609 RepID=UPI001867AD4B|nr:LuxR C-terminal-related transcriptional regulator [Pseudomonas sp. FME51]
MSFSHVRLLPELQQSSLMLLASKFSPPPQSVSQVPRQHLDKHLRGIQSFKFSVIKSPPGYGKTVLATQLRECLLLSGQASVWLTLDSDDSDLSTFKAYLVALLSHVQPDTVTVDAEIGQQIKPALKQLLEQLQRRATPLFLFLDDVHHLAGSDSARLLSMLIDHAPSDIHFILTFRGEPCLSVARHRMQGQVYDIGLNELRFSDQEAGMLMQELRADNLDEGRFRRLLQRLDGWTGGIALAVLQSRRNFGLANRVDETSGSQRLFADFFAQEVLAGESLEIREFLLKSSVLDRLSVSLCNHVLGTADSQALLRYCETHGLFLLPIDDQQQWFRYHPLFTEFLRQELHKQNEGLCLELHRRASDWFSQQHDPISAFNHACAAGEEWQAAEIMSSHCEEMFSIDENAWRLADKLPASIIEHFPNIILSQIWQLEMLWQFETCRELLHKARQRLKTLENEQTLPGAQLRSLTLMLRHRELMLSMLSDDMPAVLKQASELIDSYSDAPPLVRGSLYNALMYAQREHYQLDEVERLNSLASEHLKRLKNELGQVFHAAILGPSRLIAGRSGSALTSMQEALEAAEQLAGPRSSLAAMVAMHLAKIHYERDELDSAGQLLDMYLPQINKKGFVDQAIAGWLTRARLFMVEHQYAAAYAMLDEADVFAQEHGFERLRLYTLSERLQYLLRQGRVNDVIELGRQHRLRAGMSNVSPRQGMTSRDEARALAWVSVAQADGRLTEALNLAKQWQHFLNATGAVRNLVRWQIISAHLLLLSGHPRAAQRMLRKAISRAVPCGFFRLFIDEGAWLENLLQEQARTAPMEDQQEDTFVAMLLERMTGAAPPAIEQVATDDGAMVGALGNRELEILKMVAAGLLNREIGDKLGVTEGSVKWYLQQIYDKIGVRRRSMAAERARQLGILN